MSIEAKSRFALLIPIDKSNSADANRMLIAAPVLLTRVLYIFILLDINLHDTHENCNATARPSL